MCWRIRTNVLVATDSAASAVRNLNDHEIMGRKLRVDFSNEPGSSGGGDDNANTHHDQSHGPNQNGYSGGGANLPPLPPGKDLPPGASATDEISRILRTLPATQLLDILQQLKNLSVSDPPRATELLTQAPQLAYAVFQALLLMDLVSPEAISSVVDGQAPAQVAPASIPAAYSYGGATNTPPVPVAAPYAPPAAQPTLDIAAGQNPEDLIKQVLDLPQAVVDQLPEAEKAQIMAIRSQFGGGRR